MDSEKSDISNAVAPAPEPRKDAHPGQLQGWRLMAVQFCLCFGLLLAVMEMSIVSTALVTIAADFDDFLRINWVVLAYFLTYTGFAVFFSRISDVIGRKWSLVIGLTIFSTFSLGCGLARSLTELIAFRALQGVGGSALYSMTMVVLPEITPREKVGMISAFIGAVFAVSAVLGPILGGVITSHASWRWVFLINVPAGFAALVLVFICWRGSGRMWAKRVTWKQVDYFGAFLLMSATVLLVFALQEAGSGTFAWGSATIIATLVFSVCCWIAFGLWIWFLSARKGGVDPIFSPRIVTKLIMAVTIFDTFLTGFSFIPLVIQLPERFQIVNNNTPEQAGIHLLPLLMLSAFGSFLGGALQSRRNNTFFTLIVANSLILIGCGLLSTLPSTLEIEAAQYGYQIIFGLGVGLTMSTVTVMTVVNTTPEDDAVAQGAVAQARVFGGAIGLSVATIIFNAHSDAALPGILSPAQIQALHRSLTSISTLTLEQRAAVRDVFAQSFNEQLRVCTYVAAGCLVVSFAAWQKNPPTVAEKKKAQAEAAMGIVRAENASEGTTSTESSK